ncbi:tyrosine-type recombinase/integrase [Aeoliella mucimassa]|uniref:Site-specific tyrosine recombinase XerD n=1 Tax=Aeoliella mucimassa TaxID=2527972 RepID=A0A518ARP7_9BACT|nr:tyrosine-type recombinase/integrase [Aeoliella mucimassa]QDU57386.1 site-specific tyrosine recombinase XerD [Aeoliella mucimassa]
MRAWLFQDSRQKRKLGEDDCPWSVGWMEKGRRRSKKVGSRSMAEKYRRKKEGELANNLVDPLCNRAKWTEAKELFLAHAKTHCRYKTVIDYTAIVTKFEKLIKPKRAEDLSRTAIDRYVELRKSERRKLEKPPLSVSTLNKELRVLRAMVNLAAEEELLTKAPTVKLLKEPEREVVFITDDQFTELYKAAESMKRPADRHYKPADWWRALLVFLYTTGWRIGQTLDVRRENLDLEAGTVFARAETTKGNRDARIQLTPMAIDHLLAIKDFYPLVFAWTNHPDTLSKDFVALKKAANVEIPGRFHNLRRGFATNNASILPADVLQHVMQHRDAATTRRYINQAERMRQTEISGLIHCPKLPAQA